MKTTKMLAILFLALGLIVCQAKVSEAAPMGSAFTYQGRLMDANLPADEIYDFRFMLFDELSDGNQVGIDVNAPDVDVIDGYFTVALDFNDVGVFNGDARWLDIGVRPGDSTDPNAFVTLSPRTELTPTPYALQTRGIFVDEAGKVGIGTTEPGTKLHVESGGAKAVFGKNTASGGIGVEGQARNLSGGGVGVYGKSYSTDGVGVFGIAAMSTGKNYGVYGQSQSPDGWAGYFDGRGYFSGNVGIGTTSPTRDLHIYRNAGPAQVGIVTADTSSKAQVIFGDGEGNKWTISSDNTDDNKLHFRSGQASGTPRVTFQQNGNVGIGTTDPHDGKLVIANDATDEAYISLQPGGTALNDFMGLRVSESGNNTTKLHLGREFTSNTSFWDQVTLDGANGNVGIGTTNPTAMLDVRSRGTREDVITAHASDGSKLFNVEEAGFGDGVVSVMDNAGTMKIYLNSSDLFGSFISSPMYIGAAEFPPVGPVLTVKGNILVKSKSTGINVLELGEGLDYAEGFDVTEENDIEAGTVMVIDSDNPGKLTVSRSAYDSKVAGIVAGANGMGSGVRLGVGQFDYDVALAGRVYCNVDATQTAVQAGDLLTTSGTAGYAMKATDYDRARGAILGKAMQKLELGQKAQILVLVTLQ